jgi:uncharacterized protein
MKDIKLVIVGLCLQRRPTGLHREHGARAAKWATQNKSLICNYLSNEEFPLLLKAITGHNHGHTTENTHIGACWDADRLDLIRVGIIPQKSKFSTNAAKQLL